MKERLNFVCEFTLNQFRFPHLVFVIAPNIFSLAPTSDPASLIRKRHAYGRCRVRTHYDLKEHVLLSTNNINKSIRLSVLEPCESRLRKPPSSGFQGIDRSLPGALVAIDQFQNVVRLDLPQLRLERIRNRPGSRRYGVHEMWYRDRG